MHTAAIIEAIRLHQILRFSYQGITRLVEPHLLADDQKGQVTLSAWQIDGGSDRDPGGWKQYQVTEIQGMTVTNRTFSRTRAGYQSDGGAVFTNIRAHL